MMMYEYNSLLLKFDRKLFTLLCFWDFDPTVSACMNICLQALAAFQIALQYNPQSQEVTKKIKKINQLMKDSKRAQEVENMRSNVDMAKHLDTFKTEMVSIHVFSFYFQDCSTSMCFFGFSFALIMI